MTLQLYDLQARAAGKRLSATIPGPSKLANENMARRRAAPRTATIAVEAPQIVWRDEVDSVKATASQERGN
jgi:hypothetical protein